MKFYLPGFILLLAVTSCGSGEVKGDHTNGPAVVMPVSPSPEGKKLYEAKCITCHGADGTAGLMGAKDLQASTLEHATVVTIISGGKGTMKGFSGELTGPQIEEVARYAESLRK
jgi:mono/diheme cytochrome c family protein